LEVTNEIVFREGGKSAPFFPPLSAPFVWRRKNCLRNNKKVSKFIISSYPDPVETGERVRGFHCA
jgi:hypothetical protein